MGCSFLLQTDFVIPADKMEAYFHLKISPAAGLTFQPAVFYWAYLQRGLAGSWESLGSLTQPVTHSSASTMLLGLNYFPPLLRPNPYSEKPPRLKSRCHMNPSKFRGHKNVTSSRPFYIRRLKNPFKADQSPKPDWEIEAETPRATAFKLATGKVFSANEAVIYMRKVKLYVEMHIWGDRNFKESLALIQSHTQSVSLPPSLLPLFPFSFYLYLSHVPSIPLPSSSSSSVSAPFLWIRSMFCYHSPSNLSLPPPPSLFISVKECWSPSSL